MLGSGITVSEIKIRLTHLAVSGIRYEDPRLKKPLLQIEQVNIYPALFSFLKGELRIRELTFLRPSFFFYRSRDGTFVGPWLSAGKEPRRQRAGKRRKPERARPSRSGSTAFEFRRLPLISKTGKWRNLRQRSV